MSMTIERLKEERKTLEQAMLSQVTAYMRDFERVTGVQIRGISISIDPAYSFGKRDPDFICSGVSVDLFA